MGAKGAGSDLGEKVKGAIIDLDLDNIGELIKSTLGAGFTKSDIIEQGMREGMQVVGEKFESGDYFLAELVLAAEVMKEGLKVLEIEAPGEELPTKGTVVLATVKGDIHDIGKNLVGSTLTAAGYRVVDLGVDVEPEKVASATQEEEAQIVGLSVLLTPMVPELKNTVEILEKRGLRNKVKVVIGGACTSEELSERIGCDAFGKDAISAVRICDTLIG